MYKSTGFISFVLRRFTGVVLVLYLFTHMLVMAAESYPGPGLSPGRGASGERSWIGMVTPSRGSPSSWKTVPWGSGPGVGTADATATGHSSSARFSVARINSAMPWSWQLSATISAASHDGSNQSLRHADGLGHDYALVWFQS